MAGYGYEKLLTLNYVPGETPEDSGSLRHGPDSDGWRREFRGSIRTADTEWHSKPRRLEIAEEALRSKSPDPGCKREAL